VITGKMPVPLFPRTSVTPVKSFNETALKAPTAWSQGGRTRGLKCGHEHDGTLHLPLPAELRSSRVKLTATLEKRIGVSRQSLIKLWISERIQQEKQSRAVLATART
jgi:hypothetical protein